MAKADRNGKRKSRDKTKKRQPYLGYYFVVTDAYFGQMHGYQESKQCWLRFAETYNRVTGLEYNKSDEHIYEIMNKYGDEEKAIKIAQLRLNSYLDSGIYNPSDMCPGTTLFLLVKDIKKRVE